MDIYSDNISGRRIISFNTGETLYSRLIRYLLSNYFQSIITDN